MQVSLDDNPNLRPGQAGRWGTPIVMALVAHALLMAALTWGVHWQKDETPVAFEAEIWSNVPREAAPRAVQPPPPPPPEPAPQPEVKPEPKPAPPPPEPVAKKPDINTAELKKKQEEDKRRREAEEEKKAKAQKEREDKAEREKKALADKQKKAEELKKKQLADKQERERKATEARLDQLRDEQMRRIMGQAGATGGPEARGSAARSEGPSSGYGARVQARVRPNIRALEAFPSSLRTEIEVRALPDGTITSRRIVASSGNPAWDDAALKAIDRTGSLPRDIDGRVPTPIIIVLRPND